MSCVSLTTFGRASHVTFLSSSAGVPVDVRYHHGRYVRPSHSSFLFLPGLSYFKRAGAYGNRPSNDTSRHANPHSAPTYSVCSGDVGIGGGAHHAVGVVPVLRRVVHAGVRAPGALDFLQRGVAIQGALRGLTQTCGRSAGCSASLTAGPCDRLLSSMLPPPLPLSPLCLCSGASSTSQVA